VRNQGKRKGCGTEEKKMSETAVKLSQSASNPTLNKETAFSSKISTSDMASLLNIHSMHPVQRKLTL